MGGARERVRGRGGIADLGVDHDIRQIVVEPRRIGRDGGGCLGHRRQRLVFDDHLLGGILGRRHRLRDDEGDGGADMAHAIGRQHMMRRDRHRRAVAVVQHDIGRRAGAARWGMRLSPSASASAPVNTASTPGMARAAVTSIERISAWACGERTAAP